MVLPCAASLLPQRVPGLTASRQELSLGFAPPSRSGRQAAGAGGTCRRPWRCRLSAGRDPASDWVAPAPRELSWDGGSTDSDDDRDIDLFPEEASGDPEFVIENVLALVLIALIALSAGGILIKLFIVAYSLIAAGIRYTVVGVFLALVLVMVQPGRWWF